MAMSLLVVAALVAPFLASPSLGSSPTYQCPAGWELVEQTCFRASSKKLPWQEGRDFCKKQGADLATISSKAQQQGVSAMLTDSVWIGYNDINDDHTFAWADGSDSRYTSWSKGEPNNSGKLWIFRDGEDCVEMNKAVGFLWNDDDCSAAKRFLCSTPARRALKCDNGWARYQTSCYRASNIRVNWWDAGKQCYSMGAYRAIITSGGEQDFVKGLLRQDTWIGLHKPKGRNAFTWVNGQPLSYTKWITGEPNNYYGWNEDCVEMRHSRGYNWNDMPCGAKLAYVCEKPPH